MRVRTLDREAVAPPPSSEARAWTAPGTDAEWIAHLAVLDQLPLPTVILRDDASIYRGNQAWNDYTGTAENGEHPACGEIVHPDDHEQYRANWIAARGGNVFFASEVRLRRHDGSYRWHQVFARRSGPDLWFASCTDINEHMLSDMFHGAMAEQRNDMLDASVDCIKIIDPDGDVIHMNKSGCIALGVDVTEQKFGMRWLELLPASIRSRGQRALEQARKGQNARFAGMSVVGDAPAQYWDNILTPVIGEDGQTEAILCVSRDVTVAREAQKRLRIAGEIDALTGLLNRRSFKTRLQRRISGARKAGTGVGLMLIDLDHFKNVNDTLGHAAGDHLLRVLARRLRACMPRSAYVGRLGGDEFAILIDGVVEESQVLAAAKLVLPQLDASITYGGREINGGMSIGCAIFPRDGANATSLMSRADTALNDLKAGGRGGIRMFNKEMLDSAELAARQLNTARQIVRDDAIIPYYQPKVDLDSGEVVGFEALLRWRYPFSTETQLPATVAEAFKDYELAAGMAAQMHAKVLRDMATWRDRGLPLLPVSINAAPVEFLRDSFAARLLARLEEHRIPANLIEIEVTEHVLLERGAESVTRALAQLKKRGISVALDDFGTGHSSFAHLRDYPVDQLKIAPGFVNRMVDEEPILAIVKAIAELGPSLSVGVIAEGIETVEQRDILRRAGCRVGQGYLFGAPVPAEEVAGKLDAMSTGRAKVTRIALAAKVV